MNIIAIHRNLCDIPIEYAISNVLYDELSLAMWAKEQYIDFHLFPDDIELYDVTSINIKTAREILKRSKLLLDEHNLKREKELDMEIIKKLKEKWFLK